MASNDTNSWDKLPHERMRQRWQQAFADHRIQAHPALTRRIFHSLDAGRRRRRLYGTVRVLGSVLLLLGVVVVDLDKPVKRPNWAGSQVNSGSSAAQPAYTAEQAPTPSREIETLVDQSVEQRHLPDSTSIDLRGATALVPTHMADRLVMAKSTRIRHQLLTNSSAKITSAPAVVSISPVMPDIQQAVKSSSSRSDYVTSQTYRIATDLLRDSFGTDVPTAAAVAVWHPIKPLSILPQPVALSSRLQQMPGFDAISQYPTNSSTAQRPWRWFAQVTPLSHFQLMIAPPNATAHLSSVTAPATFSSTTWGLQLAGGMRWHHWQVQGSVGYFRRWAYYTVSENSYYLESRLGNSQQLVRETYSVSENKLLPLLGLGLSQQQLLLRGRYTAELGGQVSYLPSINQSLVALRGSVARRILTGQGGEFQLGLTMEYGLNPLRNEAKQLTLHPFMMGIGLRLQPRLNRSEQ